MEFEAFPKIPRFNRDIVISEKIDGTNAQICITHEKVDYLTREGDKSTSVVIGDYHIRAGSRNRWLDPHNDNYGFCNWVFEHSEVLAKLGEGRHFGEWWGLGIQRTYDLDHKRFSLFNSGRWGRVKEEAKNETGEVKHNPFNLVPELDVVPVLYQGLLQQPSPDYAGHVEFWTMATAEILAALENQGSRAAPGFMNPEGIIVYHTQSRQSYKITLEGDEKGKSR